MTTETAPGWNEFMATALQRARAGSQLEVRGTLTRLAGLVLEATGISVPVGSQCRIFVDGQAPVLSEVVGFSNDRAFLMPAGDVHGLRPGASVVPAAPYIPVPRLGDGPEFNATPRAGVLRVPLGDGLLGRVVDAQGAPMDHLGPLRDVVALPMDRQPLNAMDRDPVRLPLDTGVRAINGMLTVGQIGRASCRERV